MKKIILLFIVFVLFLIFPSNVNALGDGVYTIHSYIDSSYVFDISGGNIKNNSNIQLYKSNGTNAQKFKIKSLGDNYYLISSAINDNHYITTNKMDNSDVSNAFLYENSEKYYQKWIIKQNSNSTYSIYDSSNMHCIDISGGSAKNGANVQLYNSNGTKAQQFTFTMNFDAKKTIENGLYNIKYPIDENYYISNKNSIIKNSNNVELENNKQKWYFNYIGNGYYSIKAYENMNYVLDVSGGGLKEKSNVQLYISNGTKAQQWIISDAGDGNYYIVSKCNNTLLTADNNAYADSFMGNDNQKFKIESASEEGEKSVDDGYYFINSSLNTNKVLDISNTNISNGTNVQIYDLNYTLSQKWYIKYLEDGYYAILSDRNSDYALEYNSNLNAYMSIFNNHNNQKWIIRKTNNGYYILSKDGKYLDLAGAKLKNGNNIGVYSFNGTGAQKYKLTKTASGISDRLIENGLYTIESALDNSVVLDISGGNAKNGANVQLYGANGTNAQKWSIKYMSNGYYQITSLQDLTKTIDVSGGSSKPGANVQVYENNNSLAQQWIIKDAGDGYFYIVSNSGELYLDISGGNSKYGANVQVYTKNSSTAQKFKFTKASKTKVIDVSVHQGKIDWNKVANSGIHGAILRIGYWNTQDTKFDYNISEVKRLGIPYGIYLYSYASTVSGATIEANFTNDIINNYKLNPTLGIYYDIESYWLDSISSGVTRPSCVVGSNNISGCKETYDKIVKTYLPIVRDNVSNKYKVKVYANLDFTKNAFSDYVRSEVDWIAQYASKCTYTGNYSMWQYTSSATLDGINGYVDMSYLY